MEPLVELTVLAVPNIEYAPKLLVVFLVVS